MAAIQPRRCSANPRGDIEPEYLDAFDNGFKQGFYSWPFGVEYLNDMTNPKERDAFNEGVESGEITKDLMHG